jgi:FKBP-type peptidyl-prolyl cis-trans isomerase
MSGCEDPQIVPVTPPPALAAGTGAVKSSDYTPATPTAMGQTKTTPNGVKYETLREGTGPEAKPGQSVRVQYVGKLENGEIFDTTRTGGPPRLVTIGEKDQLKAWAEAMPGMRVGEIRKMIVPPELGFGAKGRAPSVPPNATLVFEIELIDILAD